MTFDVHAHVVVPEITGDASPGEAAASTGTTRAPGGGDRRHGRSAPAIAEFVDIDGILAAQDEAGVERMLLCPWVPLLYYDAEPDEGLRRARIQNDALAGLVRDHPGRRRRAGRAAAPGPGARGRASSRADGGRRAARRGGGRERARRVPRRRPLRALLGGRRGDGRAGVRPPDHARLRLAGVPGLLPLEHGGEPARDGDHGGAHGHGRRDGAPPGPARAARPRRRRAAGGARAAAARARLPAAGPLAPARVARGLDQALLLRHRSRTTTRCCAR